MLLLAHAAQEMPERERWEISGGKEVEASREREIEKYEMRVNVPKEVVLTGRIREPKQELRIHPHKLFGPSHIFRSIRCVCAFVAEGAFFSFM